MVRTRQGGSILSFVVIGGVLALLLIGGAYFVRHSLMPKDNGGSDIATFDDSDTSTQPQASDEKTSQNNGQDTSKEPTSPGQNAEQNSSDSTNDSGTGNNVAPSDKQQDANGLPATGPSNTLVAGLMLSAIMAAFVSYVRSRQDASSL